MAVLLAVPAVQAADPNINIITPQSPPAHVFIGEQGLNVTQVMGGYTMVSHYRAGDDPATEVPDNWVTISDASNFNVDPANFRGFEGTYYQYNGTPPAASPAFQVSEPSLILNMYDTQGGVASGQSRYLGTPINFKILTNLASIVSERSISQGFINILVRDQSGITYTYLYTSDTATQTLTNLLVGVSPYTWFGGTTTYWDTASRGSESTFRYQTGAYSIWAQTGPDRINQLNVVSANNNLNIIPESLTISTVPSVTRSNPFTVTVTGRPNTTYTLSIYNNPCHVMTGADCDQPPMIMDGQVGVLFDNSETHHAGDQTFYPTPCIEGTTIYQTVPHSPYGGYRYYANVTTGANGTISVGFATTTSTAPISYIIHVQGMGLDDQWKFAETSIAVNKGVVTVVAPSSAILGDNIPISGINTDSYTTYLYITGPCQPQCGANLTKPGVPLSEAGYTVVVINSSDRTWTYNPLGNGWVTKNLPIQPGTYTIYATSKPVDACSLGSCVAYSTTVIQLNPPTLTANITPEILIRDCCSDASVVVSGTTTGNPSHNISMWMFGEVNKVGDVHYIHRYITDCCGEFSFDVGDYVDLSKLAPGKYYIVLQHPMYNHVFDVIIEGDFQNDPNYANPAPTTVPPYTVIGEANKLYVVGSCPTRWSKYFAIEGADAKREIAALHALEDALNQDCIDDIYVVLNFTVKDANAPTAEFSGYPTSGSAPLGVQFIDQSEGSPTSWSWDFGDGTTSTEQNPYHVYATENTYTVRMTASKVVNSKTASDTKIKEDYIHVGATQLQAAFTADQTVGLKPLSVTFTDQSTGSPTQWFWDFGDGSYSAAENPTHIYTNTGTYSVTLTASKSGSSSTLTKPNYITVTGSPTPPPVNASQIVLKPGWNFVSTPKILASGYNTGSIFANVDMQGRSAWMWDGGLNPPQWVAITATTPIQPLYGMWIYSASNTVVNLVFDSSNNLVTPPTRSLPAGWNTIGFTGVNPTSARNTYLSVQPNWTTSMGFNASIQQYEPTIFNGDTSELTVLTPTKGYWLYMRTPGNLAAIGA